MSMVSHLHHLFNPETCQSYIHTLPGKIGPSSVPAVRASTSVPGAPTTPSRACNATAVKSRAASAPSMTSRARSWMAASAR